MDERRPNGTTWGNMYWPRPESIPQQMPEAKDEKTTLLYGPRGEALIVRQPRKLGFDHRDDSL